MYIHRPTLFCQRNWACHFVCSWHNDVLSPGLRKYLAFMHQCYVVFPMWRAV